MKVGGDGVGDNRPGRGGGNSKSKGRELFIKQGSARWMKLVIMTDVAKTGVVGTLEATRGKRDWKHRNDSEMRGKERIARKARQLPRPRKARIRFFLG